MDPRGGTGDDFTLEVSDLRTDRLLDTPLTRPPAPSASQSARPDAADADDEFVITSLAPDAPRGSFKSLPSRRARGIAVVGLIVMVCAAILLSISGPRQDVQQALFGSTPTPTQPLAPGANAFYVIQGVPWGTLTVDGRRVTPPSLPSHRPLTLARGTHTVDYRAEPFPPLHCRTSVPARSDDTCPFVSNGLGAYFLSSGDPTNTRAINLGLTPSMLPSDSFNTLQQQVAAELQNTTPSATIAPGDHYAAANGASAVAAAPLLATLSLTLQTGVSTVANGPYGGVCTSLCGNDDFDPAADPAYWDFKAQIVAQWRFAAPSGSIAQPDGIDIFSTLEVAALWTGAGWTVTLKPFSSSGFSQYCSSIVYAAFAPSLVWTGTTMSSIAAGAPNPADGCAAVFSPSDFITGPSGSILTPLSPDASLFIYRFGVVLAGNAVAHKAQPQLAVANAHEQVLALQWLQNPS